MRLVAARDGEEMSQLSLGVVEEALAAHPAAAISLTTGHTTRGLYRALRAACRTGTLDLAGARFVSSEEYLGVGAEDALSLFGWLCGSVFGPCGIPAESVVRLRGDAADPGAECQRFDAEIEGMGGLDLVVQSIGVNGHFGFNEPGCSREAATRVVTLTASTRQSNAGYWPSGSRVPEAALAMGVRTVLQARHVLLLACGANKAHALARALEGPVDEEIPCSLLRLAPRLTVIADRAALAHAGRAGTAQGAEAPAG
jgi:glucosamine-6-phosphate deaminase